MLINDVQILEMQIGRWDSSILIFLGRLSLGFRLAKFNLETFAKHLPDREREMLDSSILILLSLQQ